MSQKEATKIKYAAIEVIRNGAKSADDIECGAVMGICRRKDDKDVEIPFLAVVNSANSIRLYNLNEYKIITLDILDDDTRYMTVYTNTVDDQDAAVQMIDQLVKQMEDADQLMVNDARKELIDVEKYTDMPDAVLEGNNLSDKVSKSDKFSTSSGTDYSTQHSTTTTTTYTKQVPTVLSVKRKGKLPSQDRLSAMRDKVVQLALGEFDINPLPTPKCDMEHVRKATEKQTTEEGKKKTWTG